MRVAAGRGRGVGVREVRDAGARLGDQAVGERDERGRHDQVHPRLEHRDEGVRLLGAGREDPPRPAEDRGAEAGADPARQERRCERVALESLVLDAVEPERDRSGAVDPRAAAIEPHHAGGSSPIR
jgi:hypothetical protein